MPDNLFLIPIQIMLKLTIVKHLSGQVIRDPNPNLLVILPKRLFKPLLCTLTGFSTHVFVRIALQAIQLKKIGIIRP